MEQNEVRKGKTYEKIKRKQYKKIHQPHKKKHQIHEMNIF